MINDLITSSEEVLYEKLTDIQTPGFIAEFSPDEAQMAGAFKEDALNESDALQSQIDFVEIYEEF